MDNASAFDVEPLVQEGKRKSSHPLPLPMHVQAYIFLEPNAHTVIEFELLLKKETGKEWDLANQVDIKEQHHQSFDHFFVNAKKDYSLAFVWCPTHVTLLPCVEN